MKQTIKLTGRLDTATAQSVDATIAEEIAKLAEKPTKLVFDCSELDYISSTGLRVVLKYKKLYPQMEVVNASNDIYSVFEMTGFTRIIDVKKALRKVYLEDCQLLGEGGNGAAYRINDEEIVKVSKNPKGDEALVRESEQVREAFLLGMPTVISFDTVDCGEGRKGIVMEALDSQTLGAFISEDPSRMENVIPKYVELFRQTNAIETDSPLFRNIKEWLRSHLTMPGRIINDEEAALLSSLLDEVPDANNLVHFDGHVGNVLMYGPKDNRNLMLIDLGDTGTGHPILEIAGVAFMMLEPEYAAGCTESERITGMPREQQKEFCRRMLAEKYNVTDEAELDELVRQASLIGRLKSAYVAQRWAPILGEGEFHDFMVQLVRETISLVPEIKEAIHQFIAREPAL